MRSQLWGCVHGRARHTDICTNVTTWSAGKCRNCPRADDKFGWKIGITSGEYLDDNGACLTCGVQPPPVDKCQVCGGVAHMCGTRTEPTTYWVELGVEEPRSSLHADLLASCIYHLELELDEGRLPRSELDRLMRELYGKRFSRGLIYVRNNWRWLFDAHAQGVFLGKQRAMWEQSHPTKGEKAVAERKRKAEQAKAKR